MKTCVFAGTFDPVTIGHTEVIERCLKLFDKVNIVIADNPDKTPFFSTEDRIKFLSATYKNCPKVEISVCSGLLVDYMKKNGLTVNVRGIRNAEDYKYENVMTCFNSEMYENLITVYIPTPLSISHVSSSSIRKIIAIGADFSAYVPKTAYPLMVESINKRK